MRRKNKVGIKWSSDFAYAIGLIATDGNLSVDGRHISYTTKDEELSLLFAQCLNIDCKARLKSRSKFESKKYFIVQFSDVNFYEYLIKIGITPKKSKTIKKVIMPKKYFPDFLRGCIDGDGSISVFNHPESKNLQLKLRLASASEEFLLWIKKSVEKILKIKSGYVWEDKNKGVYTLTYGRRDGGKILKFVYYSNDIPYLKRKREIAEKLGEWRNW